MIWDPNIESNLAGYKFYSGLSSRDYNVVVDVGNQNEYTVSNLNSGITYYFAVTAYNTLDMESDFSNEVVYTVITVP